MATMQTYSATGFKAVRADSAWTAAAIFAKREVRRQYGRGGYLVGVRCDFGEQGDRVMIFDATIGCLPAAGGYTEEAFWVTVRREAE